MIIGIIKILTGLALDRNAVWQRVRNVGLSKGRLRILVEKNADGSMKLVIGGDGLIVVRMGAFGVIRNAGVYRAGCRSYLYGVSVGVVAAGVGISGQHDAVFGLGCGFVGSAA